MTCAVWFNGFYKQTIQTSMNKERNIERWDDVRKPTRRNYAFIDIKFFFIEWLHVDDDKRVFHFNVLEDGISVIVNLLLIEFYPTKSINQFSYYDNNNNKISLIRKNWTFDLICSFNL